MIGLGLTARGALVVFDHVCRQKTILRIRAFTNIYHWLKGSCGGTRANHVARHAWSNIYATYTIRILPITWFNTILMESLSFFFYTIWKINFTGLYNTG